MKHNVACEPKTNADGKESMRDEPGVDNDKLKNDQRSGSRGLRRENTPNHLLNISNTYSDVVMRNVNKSREYRWPAPVSCEMNLEVWESELRALNLFEKHGHLIDGFSFGFHQGIPVHSLGELNWFCPPNHSSALKVKDKIMKNL